MDQHGIVHEVIKDEDAVCGGVMACKLLGSCHAVWMKFRGWLHVRPTRRTVTCLGCATGLRLGPAK